jgi:hypothetical protein
MPGKAERERMRKDRCSSHPPAHRYSFYGNALDNIGTRVYVITLCEKLFSTFPTRAIAAKHWSIFCVAKRGTSMLVLPVCVELSTPGAAIQLRTSSNVSDDHLCKPLADFK